MSLRIEQSVNIARPLRVEMEVRLAVIEKPMILQEKIVEPTFGRQDIVADMGYDALSKVTLEPIPNEYVDTSGGTITPETVASGYIGYSQGSEVIGTAGTGDYRVRFFDYDGTYKDVWVNEGEDAVPPIMPDYSQEGYLRPALTFQGWNRPYTNVTSDDETGAIYIPTDGKTHCYVQLTPSTGLELSIRVYRVQAEGVFTIEWGDGTEDYISAASGNITATHTYSGYGIYHCKTSVSAGLFRMGHGASSGTFVRPTASLLACYIGNSIGYLTERNTGEYAFYNNQKLTYITIPKNIVRINSYSFASCRSLLHLTLPDTITITDSYAFQNSYSLTTLVRPSNLSMTGFYIFHNCYALKSISKLVSGNATKYLSWAFQNCYSLQAISIFEGIEEIQGYCFSNCYSLTRIEAPTTLTSISGNAFVYCYALKKVILKSSTVVTLANVNAFSNTSCLFFVPDNLVGDYQDATNWSTYANRILPMSEESNYYG